MAGEDTAGTKVYRRRFWLLGVFCMLAVLQSCTWNFYSPISGVVEGLGPAGIQPKLVNGRDIWLVELRSGVDGKPRRARVHLHRRLLEWGD